MAKVTYVEVGGGARVIDVAEGWTVMQGATVNGVAGMEAECGGSCACGTCHVYVDETSLAKLPLPQETETATLDLVAAELRPTSRLSCQITVTADLDGLIVHLPASQG